MRRTTATTRLVRRRLHGRQLRLESGVIVRLVVNEYAVAAATGERRPAITAVVAHGEEAGDIWDDITCNLPLAVLQPGQITVRTWNEHGEAARALLATGIVEDTGLRVATGFVEAEVWRVRP